MRLVRFETDGRARFGAVEADEVAELVSFISRVMTLRPGDVIGTGTPAGVGPMEVGDVVEVRIAGVGSLENKVVRA